MNVELLFRVMASPVLRRVQGRFNDIALRDDLVSLLHCAAHDAASSAEGNKSEEASDEEGGARHAWGVEGSSNGNVARDPHGAGCRIEC